MLISCKVLVFRMLGKHFQVVYNKIIWVKCVVFLLASPLRYMFILGSLYNYHFNI